MHPVSVQLPPSVYQHIHEAAQRFGVSIEAVVEVILQDAVTSHAQRRSKTNPEYEPLRRALSDILISDHDVARMISERPPMTPAQRAALTASLIGINPPVSRAIIEEREESESQHGT
jgi:hypothetical protein